MTMRIPYLNVPCIVNETCFHGQCIHVEDVLISWYEYCSCDRSYSGFQCGEKTKFNRTDWFILLTLTITCLTIGLCLLFIPFLYGYLKSDFDPQIIECTRSTPYVEVSSSPLLTQIYRIPSEHLTRRRTIIDGLIPLHAISSLARPFRRHEQIHTMVS